MNFDCDCDGVVNRIHFIRFDVQCTIYAIAIGIGRKMKKKSSKNFYHEWENYISNTLLKIELLSFVKISIYLTLCMKDLKWNICIWNLFKINQLFRLLIFENSLELTEDNYYFIMYTYHNSGNILIIIL